MNDETIDARLIEYLGRYTTFAMPARSIAASEKGPSARRRWAAPGSAVRGIGGSLFALATVAALVVVLGVGFGLRSRTLPIQPAVTNPFSGTPSTPVANPRDNFVWFTGTASVFVEPAREPFGGPNPATAGQAGLRPAGVSVAVLDWTGAVRYRFTIPPSKLNPGVIPVIASISADGTRALLDDGVVLDQTGSVVGAIPDLNNLAGTPRWTSDDAGVCAATDVAGRLSLALYDLDGVHRVIGSVPDDATVASGGLFDSSVLSCDPQSNIALVARYRYIPASAEQCVPPTASCVDEGIDTVEAALWGMRMSDGTVVMHRPDTTVAVGEPFWYGSENGGLAAEFVTRGVAVVDIPSGGELLQPADLGSANLPAVSADGSRILWTTENASRTQLTMDLVGAADGATIRSVTFDGKNLPPVLAVAYPDGSSFMVDVDGALILFDSRGGISKLSTTINLNAPPGSLYYEGMSQAQR